MKLSFSKFASMILVLTMPATTAAADSLTSGTTAFGSIATIGGENQYDFSASAGDSVLLTIFRTGNYQGGFQARIHVYDPSGSKLTVGDPRVFDAQLAVSGIYTVVVYDLGDTNTGDYNLSYVRAPGSTELGSIISGLTYLDSIGDGDLDSYSFSADTGDSALLTVNRTGNYESSFQARIHVYGPSGSRLTIDDSDVFDAQLAVSGSYTVVVYDLGYESTGDYILTYQRECGVAGDVNGDCLLSVADLLLLEQAVIDETTLTPEQTDRADVWPVPDGDDMLDVSDVLILESLLQSP